MLLVLVLSDITINLTFIWCHGEQADMHKELNINKLYVSCVLDWDDEISNKVNHCGVMIEFADFICVFF